MTGGAWEGPRKSKESVSESEAGGLGPLPVLLKRRKVETQVKAKETPTRLVTGWETGVLTGSVGSSGNHRVKKRRRPIGVLTSMTGRMYKTCDKGQ